MSIISYAVNKTKMQKYEIGKRDFYHVNLVGRSEEELFEIFKSMVPTPEVARRVAKDLFEMGVEFIVTDDWFGNEQGLTSHGCTNIGSIWY